jgi:hypothetical protein
MGVPDLFSKADMAARAGYEERATRPPGTQPR